MVLSPISVCGLCATAGHCGHIIIKHRSTSNTEIAACLAYVCAIALHGGLLGAWIGMCLDNTTRAVLVAWLFRRGRWMSKSL